MFEQAMTTEERASPPKVTKKRVCVGRDDDEVRRPGVVVITDKRTTLRRLPRYAAQGERPTGRIRVVMGHDTSGHFIV